jgi:hypothetical protein
MTRSEIHADIARLRKELETLSVESGEWRDAPTVTGDYWVARKFSPGCTWYVEYSRVLVRDNGLLIRAFDDVQWEKPSELKHPIKFCGPLTPPPPPPPEATKKRKVKCER